MLIQKEYFLLYNSEKYIYFKMRKLKINTIYTEYQKLNEDEDDPGSRLVLHGEHVPFRGCDLQLHNDRVKAVLRNFLHFVVSVISVPSYVRINKFITLIIFTAHEKLTLHIMFKRPQTTARSVTLKTQLTRVCVHTR